MVHSLAVAPLRLTSDESDSEQLEERTIGSKVSCYHRGMGLPLQHSHTIALHTTTVDSPIEDFPREQDVTNVLYTPSPSPELVSFEFSSTFERFDL